MLITRQEFNFNGTEYILGSEETVRIKDKVSFLEGRKGRGFTVEEIHNRLTIARKENKGVNVIQYVIQ